MSWRSRLSAEGTGFLTSLKYVASEPRKRRRNFCIGLWSVVVVVFFVSNLIALVDYSALIFLRLGETTVGEMDLLLNADGSRGSPLLNSSDIAFRLEDNPYVAGVAPRWLLPAQAVNDLRPDKAPLRCIILVADTEKEDEIGVGRAWSHRPLGLGETHVSRILLRTLGLRPNHGEKVSIQFNLAKFIGDNTDIDLSNTSVLPTFLANSTIFTETVLESIGVNLDQNVSVDVFELLKNIGAIPANVSRPTGIPLTVNTTIRELINSVPLPQLTNQTFAAALVGSISRFSMQLTVVDSISDGLGKFAGMLGSVILLDSNFLLQSALDSAGFSELRNVVKAINPNATLPPIHEVLQGFNIDDYAMGCVVMFNNRLSIYQSAREQRTHRFIKFSDSVFASLGLSYPTSETAPLMVYLETTEMVMLFLQSILVQVIIEMILLGCVLILALILSNVEEKTYEYGMLRALGLQQTHLIYVIVLQSIFFALPGTAIGLALSYLLNVVLGLLFEPFLMLPEAPSMSLVANVVPIAIGLSMPLIANVVPILKALRKALRDALDVYHSSTSDTQVTVVRLEKLGLNPWTTALAIMLVIFGFLIYYVIPLSFVFQSMPLFFAVNNIVIFAMLIGMCIVSQSLQPAMEVMMLKLMLWGNDRRMDTMIRRALTGHRQRSSRTFLMFTVSVASLVFGGVVFALQAKSIPMTIRIFNGADVVIQTITTSKPLPKDIIDPFLSRMRDDNKLVMDWTYVTFPLDRTEGIYRSRISNLLWFPDFSLDFYGVQENFFHCTYSEYFSAAELAPGMTPENILAKMYAGRASLKPYTPPDIESGRQRSTDFDGGSVDNSTIISVPADDSQVDSRYNQMMYVMIASSHKSWESLSVDSIVRVNIALDGGAYTDVYLAKPAAMVNKMAGFFFSAYSVMTDFTPLVMTLPDFQFIVKEYRRIMNITTPPLPQAYEKVFVRLVDGISTADREDLVTALSVVLEEDVHIIIDTQVLVEQTASAAEGIMYFFMYVSIGQLALDFFMLWMSFSGNVRSNLWEFGVTRALGLSMRQLTRAYIYEALCVVLSAFVVGTIIGTITGITLNLLFLMFLEVPLILEFPTAVFLLLLIGSLLASIGGSWLTGRQVNQNAIASVLKGQS